MGFCLHVYVYRYWLRDYYLRTCQFVNVVHFCSAIKPFFNFCLLNSEKSGSCISCMSLDIKQSRKLDVEKYVQVFVRHPLHSRYISVVVDSFASFHRLKYFCIVCICWRILLHFDSCPVCSPILKLHF
jgi:hypothetical protein